MKYVCSESKKQCKEKHCESALAGMEMLRGLKLRSAAQLSERPPCLLASSVSQIQILMTPSLAAVAIIFCGNSIAFMSRISAVCAVLGGL